MLVSAGRQAPGVSLCVCTTLVFRPNAGLNDPRKPAAVQAARASATVNPTRFGTTRQLAIGVGVGVGCGDDGGVGVGVGSGVGDGADVGVGVDVGVDVDVGPDVGPGVDPGDGAIGVADAVGPSVGDGVPVLGGGVCVPPGPPGAGLPEVPGLPGDVPFSVGGALPSLVAGGSTTAPPAAGDGDMSSGTPATSVGLADGGGVPTALSTRPVGRNADPTTTATARTARADTPTASGRREDRRCWFEATLGGFATDAAAPFATMTPHPGHAPAAIAQHRSHAKTTQDGHIRSPTRRSVDAAPTRFPQRSQ
jgi:hypothetical protein